MSRFIEYVSRSTGRLAVTYAAIFTFPILSVLIAWYFISN